MKEFFEQVSLRLGNYGGEPYIILNLSISIKYSDNDDDNYLTKGDYFILEIKDIDRKIIKLEK